MVYNILTKFSEITKKKMLQASVGVLIRTDVATKIMLLEKEKRDKFVIMEIDDRHLFIRSHKLDLVKEYVLKFKEDSLRKPMSQVDKRGSTF